nr:atp synthase assembly factor fmc1, mitochondrial [Quercus suber]
MAAHAPQARALYRRFLRELPSRTPSILANPSPIQTHIRADIAASSSPNPTESSKSLQAQLQKPTEQRLAEAEQYIHYLRAQRQYITLVERYNPGMNMDEEERVRLSARRVGINLPVEFDAGKDS